MMSRVIRPVRVMLAWPQLPAAIIAELDQALRVHLSL
jgi:hypothetical protein